MHCPIPLEELKRRMATEPCTRLARALGLPKASVRSLRVRWGLPPLQYGRTATFRQLLLAHLRTLRHWPGLTVLAGEFRCSRQNIYRVVQALHRKGQFPAHLSVPGRGAPRKRSTL